MEKLLTVPELAERLQVSAGTIYHWLSQGILGCTRIGRSVRFREQEDIAPFLNQQGPAVTSIRQSRKQTTGPKIPRR